MSEMTVMCPICGEPYKVYDFYAGDQSACPDCQAKADKKRGRWHGGVTSGPTHLVGGKP